MFRTKFVEKIKTHFSVFSNFFKKKIRAVYGIMLINIVEPDRPHDNMAHVHCMPYN